MALAIRTIYGLLLSGVVALLPAVLCAQTATPTKPVEQMLPPGTNVRVEALLQGAFRLQWSNKIAEADADYRAAVALAEVISDVSERAELPRALQWQAQFYRHIRNYTEAWAAAERSLRLYEERVGRDDPRTDRARGTLGSIGNASGEFARGEPYLRAVLAGYDRDPSKIREVEAGTAALNLAVNLNAQKRFDEAAQAQRKGIEIREKATPRDDRGIAFAYLWLGQLLASQKRPADANVAYESAVQAAARLQGSDASTTMATVSLGQAEWLRTQGKLADAYSMASRAFSLREGAFGQAHPAVAEARIVLGRVLLALGNRSASDQQFNAVLEGYDRNPSSEGVRWMEVAAYELALSHRVTKRPERAVDYIRRAIGVRESTHPNDLVTLALYYRVLALAYSDQRDLSGAEPAYQKAIDLYRRAQNGEGPDVAHLYLWLGDTYFTLGRYRDAADVGQRAVTIFARGNDQLALATAQVRLAISYRYLQRLRESEELARKALTIREQKLSPDHDLIGEAAFNLAAALRWQDKFTEAEPLYRRAFVIREKLLGPDSQHVLATRYGLALTIEGMGKAQEAEAELRRLLADRERVFGPENTDVAETIVSLVWNLRRQGRFADAAAIAERPLGIYRRVLGPDHPTVVRGLLPLAAVRQDRSEFDQADALYKDALRIRARVYGSDSTNVADSYGDLARLSMARRQYEEAAGFSTKKLVIFERLFGADDPRIIGALGDLQYLSAFNGDHGMVDALAKRILAIAEKVYGPDTIATAAAAINVAYAHRLQGKYGNVESYYERPLATYRKLLGPRHPLVTQPLALLGHFRVATGQPEQAMELYDEAISILEEYYGKDSPALCSLFTDKALLLRQLRQMGEAERLLVRSVELLRRGAGRPTASLATVLINLSFVYAETGRLGESDKVRREAIEIFTNLYGPNRLPPLIPSPILPPGSRET